jgi:hypothetical protein
MSFPCAWRLEAAEKDKEGARLDLEAAARPLLEALISSKYPFRTSVIFVAGPVF